MLQIAICDDEKRDLQHMQDLVGEVMERFFLRYDIQIFEKGEELLDSRVSFDLVFMDIRLDGEDGIDVGKKIYWKNRNAKIIFQTNFEEECVGAINRSHAFAFLTKPVDVETLEKQIDEFLKSREDIQDVWVTFDDICWTYPEDRESRQTARLPIRDIVYFETVKNDKRIRTVTEDGIFLYPTSLGNLEEKLGMFGFEICSRGILVNLRKIRKMGTQELILYGGQKLPLSRRRGAAFRERMSEFVFKVNKGIK